MNYRNLSRVFSEDGFVLANSADPDEMPLYAAFQLCQSTVLPI